MADVSVVMPARNAAGMIGAALASILEAAEVSEVVVVNDGSSDNTEAVARAVGDTRVKIIPGPRRGVAAAFNAGLAAASGVFVARCDADDLFASGRIAWQREWLVNHPDYVAVSAGFASISADGAHLADLACGMPAQDVTHSLRNGTAITTLCSWLIRRVAITQTGGAREWFETAEDVDLQFRLAFVGRVWHEPRLAYFYRLHGDSITHSRRKAQLSFYDEKASEFAVQRGKTGTDDLDLGHPPPRFNFEGRHGDVDQKLLRDQAVGHLNGQAWRHYEAGQHAEAAAKLVQALRYAPLSFGLWRSYVALRLKILRASKWS